MACDCQGCTCIVQGGPGITVGGNGSQSSPYTINAWGTNGAVSCDEFRTCISPGPGIAYDSTTGVVSARPSGDAGNTIVYAADGGLYSSPATGCGLDGTGTAADPLRVVTGPWPYPCDIATSGGVVACDPVTGRLYSEPRAQTGYQNFFDNRFYTTNNVVPPGNDLITPADTFTITVTNPDPCRSARLFIEREVDVYFTMPPGSTAAYGHDTEEMWFTFNNGATTIIDSHLQTSRWLQQQATVPAGGSVTVTMEVRVGKGSGGATYTQIQNIARTFFITR